MKIFGKFIILAPIDKEETSIDKLLRSDQDKYFEQMSIGLWGKVIGIGEDVSIDISLGDTVRFLAMSADYDDKERRYIITQDKIMVKYT